MTYACRTNFRPDGRGAIALLPPAAVQESMWDILIALYGDDECSLTLEKLGALVSLPSEALNFGLAKLEERRLIAGVRNEVTHELRAILTPDGRAVLDRYLAATSDLQVGVRD
jgi:hypothetical protein